MKTTGKAGTLTKEDFDQLSTFAREYGARVLGQKIGKVCARLSEGYKHEYPSSSVASAWNGLSTKISGGLGNNASSKIPSEVFDFLGNITSTYGAELVIQKLAKIATKMNSGADATSLKTLFPVSSVKAAVAAPASTYVGRRR